MSVNKKLDLNKLTSQVYEECKDKLQDLLDHLRQKIDDDEMPEAKKLLRKPDKNGKIPRPSNSNIIYTNQLGKLGLLAIVRDYCELFNINKQNLVPISKKLSKILWEELPEKYRQFFD